MRSYVSLHRACQSVLSHLLSAIGRSDHSVAVMRQCVEPLEQRTMLSAINIPVLVYHIGDVQNTSADGFAAQMNLLHTKGFDSITLEEYQTWRSGGSLPSGVDHPFVAIFDDATPDALNTAAPIMDPLGYRGVTAIPSALVGTSGYMDWDDIRTLVNTYHWGVASHSADHPCLGDGDGWDPNQAVTHTVVKSQALNTPSEISAQMTSSKAKIELETGVTPIGFIHPFDDVTMRSLAIASETYPLVFGGGFPLNDPHFIGDTSGRTNGELFRIAPPDMVTTDLVTLDTMLNTAKNATSFTPTLIQYTNKYKDHTGTVILDGTFDSSGGLTQNDSLSFDFSNPGTVWPTYTNASGTVLSTPITDADINSRGGNDTITIAGSLPATVDGDAGNDTISTGSGADSIVGNLGNDSLDGGAGNDTITGNDGTDWINGSSGQDTLNGGNQNDTIRGGSSGDLIVGGSGTDTADYGDKGTNGLTITMGDSTANDGVGGATEGDNISSDVENLSLADGTNSVVGNSLNNIIVGGDGTDSLNGADGNDTLLGGLGNDTLVGGNGSDSMQGEGGTDTVDYTAKTAGVTVGLGTAADDGTTGEADNVRNDIEVIWGSAFNDSLSGAAVGYAVTLIGGNGADSLTGGTGNDSLDGGASISSDTLRGGGGNDTLNAGLGTDSMFGDDGNDSFYVHDGYADTVTGGNGADVLLDTADAGDIITL